MFVPQPLEAVKVDKQTLKLYPVVDSSMKPPECTHAFQTNKMALSIPGIDRCTMLNTLGMQLNLSALAAASLAIGPTTSVAIGVISPTSRSCRSIVTQVCR
jgi:hypothetical protein